MSAVSKTVNPGSNPGSPVRNSPAPRLFWTQDMRRRAHSTISRPLGRGGAAAAIGLCAMTLAWSAMPAQAASAASSAARCANAGSGPDEASLRQLRRAVACLIAKRRAALKRPALERDPRLKRVAQRHTRVMVAEDCFQASCPGEPSLRRRIRQSGYLDGAARSGYAQSTGCATSPRAMVRAWMASAPDRRRLVKRRFRDLGVGVVRGAPESQDGCRRGGPPLTFAALLAWRRP